MAKQYEELEIGRVYNFIPPEGEYPKCYGKCILSRRNGAMLGLTQQEDKAFPLEVMYDARGERPKDAAGKLKEIPREIGKQGWVRYTSFKTIE